MSASTPSHLSSAAIDDQKSTLRRARQPRRRFKVALAAAVVAVLVGAACSGSSTTSPGISGGSDSPGDEPTSGSPDGDNGGASDKAGSPDDNGVAGETPGDDGEVIDTGDDVVLTSGLVRFGDCDALLGYLRDEYSERVGPWGFDDDGWVMPMPMVDIDMAVEDMDMAADVADMADDAAPTTAAAAPAPVEGVDFSGTNVQEQGVDEADIIKTDGNRIFTISSGRLVVVDAAQRRELGAVELAAGSSPEMFISGDSVLVVQSARGEDYDWRPVVVMQRVEAPADAAPRVLETLHVEGQYLSARGVAGTARIVLRHDPQWNFPFVYPQGSAGEERAKQANIEAVRQSTLDDWLPNYSTTGADVSGGALLGDCANVHAPSVFSGFGITGVMNVPVNGSIDPAAATLVTAPGDTVYASPQSLFVATTVWGDPEAFEDDSDWERAWQDRSTSIHRFDISDAAAGAVYEASGDVDGVIHNQFSLSEHAGHLRVVTTTSGPWGDDSDSQVRVLRQDGSRLVEVGSVANIGRGEQVQSVRFVGDIGYVVTFRQIDPFYTIDLSDPANPRILGELKIPGFSSYLHPISDTIVLGVGSDADEDGFITGAKVSLFDVSDLSAPREVSVWTAPDGWNDIGWDHRAFLWWAPLNIAVIPVTVHSYSADSEPWSGAVVLHVADGSINEQGRIEHVDDSGQVPGETECRRITEDDLPQEPATDPGSDASYANYLISSGPDVSVIACALDQGAQMVGFSCYRESLEDEFRELGVTIERDEEISLCWPDYVLDQIARSIVIDDDLWTLSFPNDDWRYEDGKVPARLQVNDLATLQRLATLNL